MNDNSVRQQITARIKDVGGINVSRALPVKARRMIGAWCFLDHAGPAVFQHDGEGMHVGPHPHMGLQTFTWMLEGEVLHRDSLGSRQIIRPGQVNLMTAGHGIAHSEDMADGQRRLHAAQLWIALPDAQRDMAPRFDHYPDLPQWRHQGATLTLLTGQYQQYQAPTLHYTPLLGMDIVTTGATSLPVALAPGFEYGVFVLQGSARCDDHPLMENELLYLGTGLSTMTLHLDAGSRVLVLGGEPFGEPVLMWWNFVGRDKAGIQQAVAEWNSGSDRFGRVSDDDRPPTLSPLMP